LGPPNGWIDGLVVDPLERPLRGAMIIIVAGPDDHTQIAAISDIDGRFMFGPLMKGRYRLRVIAEGCRIVEHDVEVRDRETVSADFAMTSLPA
jgi:hypothetical protein